MTPPTGPCGYGLLIALTCAVLIGTLLFLPLVPCPAECWKNDQLVGYTKLPGVTTEQVNKLLAWADSFPCHRCDRWRRVSVVDYCLKGTY